MVNIYMDYNGVTPMRKNANSLTVIPLYLPLYIIYYYNGITVISPPITPYIY